MTESDKKHDKEETEISIRYSVMAEFFAKLAIDDPAVIIAMLKAIEDYCRIVSISIENEQNAHIWDRIKQHIAETCDLFDDLLHNTADGEPEEQP